MLRLHGLSCERCGRHEQGVVLTGTGQLLCGRCRGQMIGEGPQGPLRRIFRIRPRRGADGRTVYFERYDG